MYELNQEIARKFFVSLILDHEYPAVDNLPALVVCRVLIDGYYHSKLTAETRQEAIEKFNNTVWRF